LFLFFKSKYKTLIFSAFSISFSGVLPVFLMMPWVAKTRVATLSVLSQKAKIRMCLVLNNVRNSHISPFSFLKSSLSFLILALSILKIILCRVFRQGLIKTPGLQLKTGLQILPSVASLFPYKDTKINIMD